MEEMHIASKPDRYITNVYQASDPVKRVTGAFKKN
jgi:hypothetical protein